MLSKVNNMAEEKFFTDDMSLKALLDGRHWDDLFPKPKVKTFDPIYGPTPFKPTGTIVARYERQICRQCGSFSFSFEGIFKLTQKEDGTESYQREPDYLVHEKKQVIDIPIPKCYECA